MFYQWESEKHEQQGTALLAELGKFVVSFERVCDGMRNCIECALWRRTGLRDYPRYQTLVHGKTAGRLRSILHDEYARLTDQDEDDKARVNDLIVRISNLTAARNDLIHGYWFLNFDYENADEEFHALALAHSVDKNGPFSHTTSVGKDTLAAQIPEATKIQVLLRRLAYSLNQKGFKVSNELDRRLSYS